MGCLVRRGSIAHLGEGCRFVVTAFCLVFTLYGADHFRQRHHPNKTTQSQNAEQAGESLAKEGVAAAIISTSR
jgi:hypothetical protein